MTTDSLKLCKVSADDDDCGILG